MGSGENGRCPECGGRFDLSTGMGVTQRSASAEAIERGDRIMLWFKVGSLAAAALACVALGLWNARTSPVPMRPLVLGAMFGGVLGFAAFVIWFTDENRR